MCHPFFDDLRTETTKMPNGKDLPPLFNFTREGALIHVHCVLLTSFMLCVAELSIRPDLNRQLVPSYCEPELAARGIDLNNFKPIPLEDLRITLD
jgi:glycogen synthase kinase 3 beta